MQDDCQILFLQHLRLILFGRQNHCILLLSYYFEIPIQEDIGDDNNVDQNVANELLKLAKAHNERLRNVNTALHEMIALPKAPYGKLLSSSFCMYFVN